MEEVASTARLVDPAAVDAKVGLTATLPRSNVEAALQDEAGADLFLEIARIQNGERDDRIVKVAWERGDLEELLNRTSGDTVTLSFDEAELESMLADVEAHGLREKALVLTIAAATAAGMASSAGAYVAIDGGGGASTPAAVSGIATDASTSGVPGAVSSIATDASTSGTTDPAAPTAGVNLVTDNTSGGQPGAVSGFTTDASTSGQTGGVSGFITDTGAERTRIAEPAGGSGFSLPNSAIDGAFAAGLALLIAGAAFVTRTRHRAQPA